MSGVTLQRVIQSIQTQIPALGEVPFTVDQEVAQAARDQFMRNYNWNLFCSSCSSLAGLVSFAGFGFSAYELFTSPTNAIVLAGFSFAINKLWVATRNPEGYALQSALDTSDEEEIIRRLSLGANIYQSVWPFGGAAANLFPIVKGSSRTVMQMFAKAGCSHVVAYLAMLEPELSKRAQMATDALPYAKNKKTAKLLLDLGGNIHGQKDLLSSCSLRKDLELVQFFVEAGARLDAGILDYQKWQADYDRRERDFRGNWFPGNNEGVSLTLHPDFKTPLEQLLAPNYGPHGRIDSPFINNPASVLEAMHVSPEVYQNKKSAEELYHSLNQAGVRIRLHYTQYLFSLLYPKRGNF